MKSCYQRIQVGDVILAWVTEDGMMCYPDSGPRARIERYEIITIAPAPYTYSHRYTERMITVPEEAVVAVEKKRRQIESR